MHRKGARMNSTRLDSFVIVNSPSFTSQDTQKPIIFPVTSVEKPKRLAICFISRCRQNAGPSAGSRRTFTSLPTSSWSSRLFNKRTFLTGVRYHMWHVMDYHT